MVGLSDIPFVGKALDRISDATVEAVFRGLRYLFCYQALVNVLDSEIEKVNIQDGRLSRKAAVERADGKTIEDHVLKWQKEVEEIQESAKEFSEKYKNRPSWRCIQCLPIPEPLSRFRMGKEAAQKSKRVTELINSGKDLMANEIAYFPALENVPKTFSAFQNFPSRKDAYRKLWDALVSTSSSSQILGIYGMPGVGKTLMMEKFWKEIEKKIFDKVTRADVGCERTNTKSGKEELDVIKLQNQIAGYLDCHFESKYDQERRANQLKHSFINGVKILVILDDVWSAIPLDTICIPFIDGRCSNGSKILLTSRKREVCFLNNCMDPVKITTLTVDEAWDLFRNTVGSNQIESLHDKPLKMEVCNKCAGLPLLIHAVGKALQFMSHNTWKDALYQLENGRAINIPGIDPHIYACVELSIDKLPDDAKSCLFLCSLFPEDVEIHIRMLMQLATSTQLVDGGRSRVSAMFDVLKSSSLLLEGKNDELFKLHDIIRDVGRSIAVTDQKYAFLLARLDKRLHNNVNCDTRKLLRIDIDSPYFDSLDIPVCPNLHSLWLQCNYYKERFSGGFFNMFMNLRFLVLQNVFFHSSSQQFSLQPLGTLRTLLLDDCDFNDIYEMDRLFPENLQTLCIWGCRLPVPLHLAHLIHLQKLEIQPESSGVCFAPNNVSSQVYFVPNTMTSLSILEE